jgi:predicted RNA binding protein YcfA (HicA-like mRNA interferase family)
MSGQEYNLVMTKRKKRLERIRQNPKSISFQDLQQVLLDYGFDLKRSSGSHHIFEAVYEDDIWQLIIPFRKPHVKPTYVKEALIAIDDIIARQSMEEDEDDDGDT